MLAQLVKNADIPVLVIDCFSDLDTTLLASGIVKVDSLAINHLLRALSALKKVHKLVHVIYGSGFESNPESLEYLHDNFNVLGNSPAVFYALQNKRLAFSAFTKLNIIFPEVVFQLPKSTEMWLVKPVYGEGGMGVRMLSPATALSETVYFQQLIDGDVMSVLFVSSVDQIVIYGFHKQQVISIDEDLFVFSGLISFPAINDKVLETITKWIKKITNHFNLKGINSLDFILKGSQCYLLEVNPRPSASMQLYPNSLLLEHIKCFLGGRLEQAKPRGFCQGYKIIFAKVDCLISQHICWPDWAMDIPSTGSIINTARPICSIIAGGKNEQEVEIDLVYKQQIIYKLLEVKMHKTFG